MQTQNYKQFEIGFARYHEKTALLFRLDDTNDGYDESISYRFSIMAAGKTEEEAAAVELKSWLDEHADDEFPCQAASIEFDLVFWPGMERGFSATLMETRDLEITALREATDQHTPKFPIEYHPPSGTYCLVDDRPRHIYPHASDEYFSRHGDKATAEDKAKELRIAYERDDFMDQDIRAREAARIYGEIERNEENRSLRLQSRRRLNRTRLERTLTFP